MDYCGLTIIFFKEVIIDIYIPYFILTSAIILSLTRKKFIKDTKANLLNYHNWNFIDDSVFEKKKNNKSCLK